MNTYDIAGLKVNFEPFGRTQTQAQKYICKFSGSPDIEIMPKESNLEKYISVYSSDREMAYYMLSGAAFYRKLLGFDGFMLHSSAISYNGKAYLFSGQCGIGKSTHAGHWKTLLQGKCTTINDDKPAVRFMSGTPFACGTPWSGKYDISQNVQVPIGGICFISRGDNNEMVRLDKKTAAMRILEQSSRGADSQGWDILLSLIDRLVGAVPVYRLACINDISAAVLSCRTMTGEDL